MVRLLTGVSALCSFLFSVFLATAEESCPFPNSEAHRQVKEKGKVTVFCRCKPGFKKEQDACVENTEVPAISSSEAEGVSRTLTLTPKPFPETPLPNPPPPSVQPDTAEMRKCFAALPDYINAARHDSPGMGAVCDSAQRELYTNIQAALKIPQGAISVRAFANQQLEQFYRTARTVPNNPTGGSSDYPGNSCVLVSRLRQEVQNCLRK